jgi:hypothetical protein
MRKEELTPGFVCSAFISLAEIACGGKGRALLTSVVPFGQVGRGEHLRTKRCGCQVSLMGLPPFAIVG